MLHFLFSSTRGVQLSYFWLGLLQWGQKNPIGWLLVAKETAHPIFTRRAGPLPCVPHPISSFFHADKRGRSHVYCKNNSVLTSSFFFFPIGGDFTAFTSVILLLNYYVSVLKITSSPLSCPLHFVLSKWIMWDRVSCIICSCINRLHNVHKEQIVQKDLLLAACPFLVYVCAYT